MSSAPTRHFALFLSLAVLGAAGCGDDSGTNPGTGGGGGSGGGNATTGGSGGAGGSTTAAGPGGGGAPESVLGTSHEGDCTTAADFADACDAEGGLLADNCQDAACGGPGWRATCYEPPPAPGPEEFSCDGLFNCAVGEICRILTPSADGCFSHTCEALPAACVDDPTCECLLAQADSTEQDTCELDEDGNPTYGASDI
jgi:hypothetical protein